MYRAVLLYAASGVGKSSLVNAGLIPLAMDEGYQVEAIRIQPKKGQEIIVERLSEGASGQPPFLPSILMPDEAQERVVLSVEELLETLRQRAGTARPLLIFDQFEEWVTLFEEERSGEARAAKQRILDALVELVKDSELPVKLLIVFREDYLAQLTPLFQRCPNLPDQCLRLTHLRGDQIYRTIRGPFEEYPREYATELSASLAREIQAQFEARVGGGEIHLTEVQIVCRALFESGRQGAELDGLFAALGGVQGVLEQHLEHTYGALEPAQRGPAIALLSRMVTAAGTRNVISQDDLLSRVEHEEKASRQSLSETLDSLEQKTRLVRRQRRREVYYYEITSEFLVPWIREKAEEQQAQKRLAQQRAEAEQRLERAEAERRVLQERAEAERQRAEEQARAAWRLRLGLIVVSVLLATWIALAFVANRARNTATLERDRAVEAYETADAAHDSALRAERKAVAAQSTAVAAQSTAVAAQSTAVAERHRAETAQATAETSADFVGSLAIAAAQTVDAERDRAVRAEATVAACPFPIDDQLSAAWQKPAIGCSTSTASIIWAAWQDFEKGYMLWRSDTDHITILYDDGNWMEVLDQWNQVDPIPSRGTPPAGKFAALRGFGYIWGRRDDVFNRLGWALEEEIGFCARVQDFQTGLIFHSADGSCPDGQGQWWETPEGFKERYQELFFSLQGDRSGTWQRVEPCLFPIDDQLSAAWQKAAFGCPNSLPSVIWAAWQDFEKGYMLWRSDSPSIMAFRSDSAFTGTWTQWPDVWSEGTPIPPLAAPQCDEAPIVRGFGYLWRTEETVRDQLGCATEDEQGFCARLQDFETGLIFHSADGPCPDGEGQWRETPDGFKELFLGVQGDQSGTWQLLTSAPVSPTPTLTPTPTPSPTPAPTRTRTHTPTPTPRHTPSPTPAPTRTPTDTPTRTPTSTPTPGPAQKALPLQGGDRIALQADTGKYLSRIDFGDHDEIWASKWEIDKYSRFEVTVLGENTIALQADTGNYLSRIRPGIEIWVSKTATDQSGIDTFSRFRVTYLDEETIALQADTGKYWSRINFKGNDEIWAAKDTLDYTCKFRVTLTDRPD
jgi:hypothetical protein